MSQYNLYNADLKIDIDNQFIYANVEVNYICNLGNTTEINFYIHKDMEIDEIICNELMSYILGNETAHWSPFVLESKLIKLTFTQPLYEQQIININFRYKGHIDIVTHYEVNRLTKEWIELGIYTPWFPLSEQFEQALFNVAIQINEEYKVINSKRIDGYQVISQVEPNQDCTIIAANTLKCKEIVNNSIHANVYYTEERYDDLAERLSNYTASILNYYQRLGVTDNHELSLVIAPRENGGGYCRPGLIVLTPDVDESEIEYFKFVAHELAHLWWCKVKYTNTWEDWLNESFAEYSALLVLRDIFGIEEFNKIIQNYNQKTKSIPPIIGLDRQDKNARLVLYMKGPLILSKLEKSIGKPKFEQLLHAVHISNVDTTEKLIEKLYEITNLETKDYFIRLLNQ